MWLSLYGGMNGIFQFLFFPHFIGRFGPRPVFVFNIVSSAAILAIFPFENLTVVVGGGPNLVVWLLRYARIAEGNTRGRTTLIVPSAGVERKHDFLDFSRSPRL